MCGPRVRGWVPVRVVRGWREEVEGMEVGGLGGLKVVVVVDMVGAWGGESEGLEWMEEENGSGGRSEKMVKMRALMCDILG